LIGAAIPTNPYNGNQFSVNAAVTINYNPSGQFYITFIGMPETESPGESSIVYPMGAIINASAYYLNPYYQQYSELECQNNHNPRANSTPKTAPPLISLILVW
jgi:Flp pilus assembly protein TadG